MPLKMNERLVVWNDKIIETVEITVLRPIAMILAQITHQIIPTTAMAMLSAAITTAALAIVITTAEIAGEIVDEIEIATEVNVKNAIL